MTVNDTTVGPLSFALVFRNRVKFEPVKLVVGSIRST